MSGQNVSLSHGAPGTKMVRGARTPSHADGNLRNLLWGIVILTLARATRLQGIEKDCVGVQQNTARQMDFGPLFLSEIFKNSIQEEEKPKNG